MYTALKNSGMDHEKVELAKMPHKAIDRDLIISSDILYFAGGGLFGINYMNNHYPQLSEVNHKLDFLL